MLTSLFGDLRPLRGKRSAPSLDEPQGFAATAIMEHLAEEESDLGVVADSHVTDLVVSGSPAQAIRDHFNGTRADLGTASRQITLLDPSRVWASQVLRALSDASGRPVEKLHLREQGTLRTLAMIERTLLERRNEEALRIYHADVRASGHSNAAIPEALMERSHMVAVILGSMSPQAVDEMLGSLYFAIQQPTWRCPTLLFVLPSNAVWISNKITTIDWPARLRVQVLNESLGSASAVWNALLGMWNRVKTLPALIPSRANPHVQDNPLGDFSIKVADLSPAHQIAPSQTPPIAAATTTGLAPRSAMAVPQSAQPLPLGAKVAGQSLSGMRELEGLLGCAVVDADTGLVLARQTADNHTFQLDIAAAGVAQVLRAHKQAAREMGSPDDIEEIMTTGGGRHHLLRTSVHHPGLFLFALLDKEHANLALCRYKLMEAERRLL